MTNTTDTQTTETPKVKCGNCSKWDTPIYHLGREGVKACYAVMFAAKNASVKPEPVIVLPVEPRVIDHQPRRFGRWSAVCYRTGCKTHLILDRPFTLKCRRHGGVVKVKAKQLIGTVSTAPKHHCDSSCIGAVGPVCVCSCGGANHGVGWLTKV